MQCRSFSSVVFAVWPHISLIGCVFLGGSFSSSSYSTVQQCHELRTVRRSEMSLGLGGIFSRWGHTCAITSALQCSGGGDTRALLGGNSNCLLYIREKPDIEATILLPDITSSSDRLESS